MLTIKAPIELKCATDPTTVGDSFGERIRANYGVMGAGLNSEELLHLVSRPPEIYMGEGGITNLVTEMGIENHQINKVEIINNFLNRVLVQTDANLTYQDRVFITNILNQLGIKDDRQFMEQVFRLKTEVQHTDELVNLYWNNLTRLETLVTEYKKQEDTEINHIENQQTRVENRLYETIMNRLQTGAIYRIVQNFNHHTEGDTTITGEEYRISEQMRITQNILLNRLQNVVRHEETPMTFRHENLYEDTLQEETVINENTVNSRVNSAILLNMIDNLYQSRYETLRRGDTKNYHMESIFYEGADNTIQRITHHIEQQYVHNEIGIQTEERVEALNEEIHLVQSILSESHTDQLRMLTDADYRQYRNSSYYGGNRTDVTNTHLQTNISGDINREGDTYHVTQQQSVSQTQDIREGDRLVYNTEVQNEIYNTENQIDNLKQELEIINQHNLERREEYQRNLNRIEQTVVQQPTGVSKQQAFRDSMLALEHPQEFLREVKGEAIRKQTAKEQTKAEIGKALPDQNSETTKLLRQYLEQPELIRNRFSNTETSMTNLMQDITRIEYENRVSEEKEHALERDREFYHEVVTETVRDMKRGLPEVKVDERHTEQVSLVHKSQESVVDEELIEELVKQNRQIEIQNHRIDTIVNRQATETKSVINHTVHHTTEEYNQDVVDAVERSIHGQMDTITEKVYDKLSKRLNNERIRRGL